MKINPTQAVTPGSGRFCYARMMEMRSDLSIYIELGSELGLDEIEDAIESELGSSGEVSGTGTGTRGSNIDLEIFADTVTSVEAIRKIQNALRDLGIVNRCSIVFEGIRFPASRVFDDEKSP